MTQASSIRPVRDVVAQADQQRRARAASGRLARLAPLTAGAALLVAAAGRVFGWPVWLGLGALGLGALAAGAYGWLQRRSRDTTDAMAAAVDSDAGLAGELRSAHWFEARTDRDDWAAYHLDRAIARARTVDWTSLYPAARSARAWVVTGVLAAATIALAVRVPVRAHIATAAAGVFAAGQPGAALSDELQKKLAALLAQLDQTPPIRGSPS